MAVKVESTSWNLKECSINISWFSVISRTPFKEGVLLLCKNAIDLFYSPNRLYNIYIYVCVCLCVCTYVSIFFFLMEKTRLIFTYADRQTDTHSHTYWCVGEGATPFPGSLHFILIRTLQCWVGCPRGVMVKAMNCGIVVREFVLQSRYYVHFRANTLGKGMNPLILPPAMGK